MTTTTTRASFRPSVDQTPTITLLGQVDHSRDERHRATLTRLLDDLRADSELLGRSLGLTASWGTTRWVPGPDEESLVAHYKVVVTGETPSRAELQRLVRRLARDGWSGNIQGHGAVMRLDCRRGDLTMSFAAHDRTVTLSTWRAPVTVGRILATRVLVGVFESEG